MNKVFSFYSTRVPLAWATIADGLASEQLLGKQQLQSAQPFEMLQAELFLSAAVVHDYCSGKFL